MRQSSDNVLEAFTLRSVDGVGVRRVTLRKNFQEETNNNEGVERTIYTFDETDVYIVDRSNLVDYVTANFTNLFELGLRQCNDMLENQDNENQLQYLLKEGRLVGELKTLGQQITEIMLEVM